MSNQPTPLTGEFLLYETADGKTRVECRFVEDTLWLTQALMAELFQIKVPTVNEHLKTLYLEGEIQTEATIRKFLIVRQEGTRRVSIGAGYGWEPLARASWLGQCRLFYWGDMDTHGFAMLDQLRSHFPQVEALMMDQETLLAHREHWGEEPKPVRHDLPRLTPDESTVYDALRFERYQPLLRLEQERISYAWVCERVARSS